MIECEVTRQLSLRATPLLYLIFLLMCLHKIARQNFWSLSDVYFEKQTRVSFGLGLGLPFGSDYGYAWPDAIQIKESVCNSYGVGLVA